MKRKIILAVTVLLLQNATHTAMNAEQQLEAARNAMIQLDLDFDNEKDLKYAITLILMENTQHDWGRKSVLTRTEQSQLKTLAQALIETKILNDEDQEIINHYLQTPLQEQTPKAIAEKAATTKKEGSVEWYLKKFNDAKTEQLAAAGAIPLSEMIEILDKMLKEKRKLLKSIETKRADKKTKNKAALDNEIGALKKFITHLENELKNLRTDQGKKITEQRTAEKAAAINLGAPSLQPKPKPLPASRIIPVAQKQNESDSLRTEQKNLLQQASKHFISNLYKVPFNDERMETAVADINSIQFALQENLLLLENLLRKNPSKMTELITHSKLALNINILKGVCDFNSQETQNFLVMTFNTIKDCTESGFNRKKTLQKIFSLPQANDHVAILKLIILIMVQVVGDFNLIQKIFSTLDFDTQNLNDPTEKYLSSMMDHLTNLLQTFQNTETDIKNILEQEIIPTFNNYLLGDTLDKRSYTKDLLKHLQENEIIYNENNELMLISSMKNLNELSIAALPRIHRLRLLIGLYLTTLEPAPTNKETIDAFFDLLKTDTRDQFSSLTQDDLEKLAQRIFKFLSKSPTIEPTDANYLQNILLLTDNSFMEIIHKNISQLSRKSRADTLQKATTALNEAGKENQNTAIALASIKNILNWSGTWNPSADELKNERYLHNQLTLLKILSELAQQSLRAQNQEEQIPLEENDEVSVPDLATI